LTKYGGLVWTEYS